MDASRHYIYIDESGIHKSSAHSSFVFVYIWAPDRTALRDMIIEIERSLHILHFHWSDHSTRFGWGIRRKFIEKTGKLPFTFKFRILKNPIKPAKELHDSLLMLLDKDVISEICIDGDQPKWFERYIKKSLRDRGFPVKTIQIVRDVDEPLLRLADALANVVRIYHDDPRGLIAELYEFLTKKMRTD